MKLLEFLITQRTQDLSELDPALKQAVAANPSALRLLAEHRALGRLTEHAPPAPAWDQLRDRLTAGVTPTKEHPMTMLMRLLTAKSWAVRLAIAGVLVLALATLALLLPGRNGLTPADPAWADTTGYLLTINLPVSGDLHSETQSDPGQACPELQAAEAAIQEWVTEIEAAHEALKAAGEAPQEIKLKLNVNLNQQEGEAATLLLTVLAAGTSPEELESLIQRLAAVPGLPAPTVEDATWLSDGALSDANCLGLRVMDQMLFLDIPHDATEEEIEQQIREWIAREHPGQVPQIEIIKETATGADGQPQIKIKVKIKTEDDGAGAS